MNALSLMRSVVLAALVSVAGASAPVLAQQAQPLVMVPDTPGGGGGAVAGNAVATANVNVRQGPGTNHRVIDVLQRGESVFIVRCQNNWCLIEHDGPTGWVSRNYLRSVIDTGRPGGGGGSVGGPVGGARLVCFFEGADFRGPNFCARPGDREDNLGAWGRRIMSVRVDGRTTVDVCSQRSFRDCATFTRDVPLLNRALQNNVGSYWVHR